MSLIEVMVAASLTLVLMGVIWGGMQVLRRTTLSVRASQEPRKQLRVALQNLQNDVRAASYIFPDGTYNVNGVNRTIEPPGTSGSFLALAIPENSVSPLTFSVALFYSDARPKTDPRNPTAQSLFYHKPTGVDPPLSDLPGEIDLEALPANGTSKVFDAYLRAGDGFQVETSANQHAVTFRFNIERREAKGELQASTYQTTLTLRNTI